VDELDVRQKMKQGDRKLLIVLACVLSATFFIIWKSQAMNLSRIQRHISEIQPEWQEFQRKNNGFEGVSFYSFTGGNGMFSAVGEVKTEADLAKLTRFMESTNPPRPILLRGLRVLESEEKIQAQIKAIHAEQGGTGQPATRSQSKSEGSDKPNPEAEGHSR
jgi:hypothetical protein